MTRVREGFAKLVRGRSSGTRPLSGQAFAVVDVDLEGIDKDTDEATGIAILTLTDGRFRPGDLRYCCFPCRQGQPEPPGWRRDYDDILALLAGKVVGAEDVEATSMAYWLGRMKS